MQLDIITSPAFSLNNVIIEAVKTASRNIDYLTCMFVENIIFKGKIGLHFELAPHQNFLIPPPRVVQCAIGDNHDELIVRYLGDKDLMRSYASPKITDEGDKLARDYKHNHISHLWVDHSSPDKLSGLAAEIVHFMTTGEMLERSVVKEDFPVYDSTIVAIEPATLR